MSETSYTDSIYPFQDEVLSVVQKQNVSFYLTGGTALSRGYLHHRFSDDLDFFINDNAEFKTECSVVVKALKRKWKCDVAVTSETYLRLFLYQSETGLKVDFVNDVPYRYGEAKEMVLFHRVDNLRNILSNKICALSRLEPKDVADIVCISKNYGFNWEEIIGEAKEKDLWVEPLEVCRILKSFDPGLLDSIKWIDESNKENIDQLIDAIHDDIFFGRSNSLHP